MLNEHRLSPSQLEVLLTDDEEIRRLNREFRALDEATDVLSFPAPGHLTGTLGEIAISVEYAARQAMTRGIHLDEELAYLAIHGGLHLLGWDDESAADRKKMVSEMDRISRLAGLPGYPDWHSIHEEQA